jgi:hypothetical protein
MKTSRRKKSYNSSPLRPMTRWIVATLILISAAGAQPSSAQTLDEPRGSTSTRRADVKGALEDSIRFLMIEHAVRIGFQEKTREGLKGPFFPDYQRSVRIPGQWGDTDSWTTNYIGHPGQGAATGFIWLYNSQEAEIPVSMSRTYLTSRLRATAWAAGYSVQFEVGPVSEASIGNVGMNPKTAGWVDYVATPIGGLGIMVAEDLLEKFVIRKIEDRTDSRVVRATLRMLLNPSRTTANVAGMRSPWYRVGRSLGH